MPAKVQIKNLRVNGQRIPLAIFKAVANEMLPDAANVTRHEQRHGKQTALSVARESCAVDKDFRKDFLARCANKMAVPARAKATAMGYVSDAGRGPDGPKTANGIDPCPEYPNGLHADGTDYVGRVAEIKRHMEKPPAERV